MELDPATAVCTYGLSKLAGKYNRKKSATSTSKANFNVDVRKPIF